MKRIRLDIGALTASPEDGGSFMFFLYREGMDKSLPVKLSPPDMHAVLSNFNKQEGGGTTIHTLFSSTLQQFRIELLEVTVTKENDEAPFTCELLLFDGEKERVIVSSIKHDYKPEELIGKKIIVVANLAPARLTGVTSEGMLLAATNNACGCQVIFVDDIVPAGTQIK